MSLIPFPDIPSLPGVPNLPRLPSTSTIAQAVGGAVAGALWQVLDQGSQWGIFDSDGNPLGDPSNMTGITSTIANSLGFGSTLSVNAFDYGKETRVSDFPVERGEFASYNKVEMPGEPTVTFAFEGSESDRTSFLDAIDTACLSTDLYSVVTPEVTYVDYTLQSYNYRRTASAGAYLLIVELRLKEVRQVSAQFAQSQGQISDPSTPSAAAQTVTGKVQAATPDSSTLKKLADKIPSLFGG